MRRKILLLLVTLLLLGLCSRTNADPKNWPAPWLDTVTLKIGAYNPVLKPDHNGGTWEGKKGAKYAIDFGDNENEGIKLFSPVDGEIVCSNLYEETLAKGNEKSCRNGHGTYGKHVIIKPHGDDNNTFIMAHMTDESANFPKFVKSGDKYVITKGEEVGYLGRTGGDWPAHLHFEFIKRPYSDKIQVFGITDEQMRTRAVIKGGISEAVKPSITTPKNNATIRKQVNKSFTYTLKAEGSEATWSKKSGSLPTGVRVDSGGTISGTPTQTGQFKFVIQAQNSAGVDTKNVTLDIYGTNEVPKITTTSLTTGKVNENYSFTVKATGRTPITWTASGLPSGLSIDSSTGTISGKTAYSGKFYVQIVAKNKIKSSATKTLWLEIYEKPAITTSSINETAYTFTDYNATFTATGYPAPTWSITVLSQLPPGLTLDSKTGVLSGKPTKTGTYNFKVKATNSVDSATKKFKIVVKVGNPQITTSSLPKGKVGKAYSTQLTGNNLPSGSAWAATSALPAGMTLSKTGVLSGTPKSAGTYYIYAMAINKTGVTTTKTFTLTVTDGLKITTESLPDATLGKSYKVTLKATGATAITWFADGTLPAGFTLSSKGVLSGTPIYSGTYYIYARAMNAYGTYVSKTFTLKIIDGLAITTTKLSNATVGKSYKATLKATSATAITWFADGTLPTGLTLSSKGVLSGTPVYSGTYYIYAKAMNAYGAYVSKTFTLKIVDGLAITTTKLSNATVGKSYKATLKAKGATAITWFADGRLPPGLTLSPEGVLSGVPACKGTYYVYARAMNIYGTYVSKTLTLTVGGSDNNSAVCLSDATVDEEYEESFSISFPSGYQGKITHSKSGKLPKGLSISSEGEYITIKGTPKEAGIFRVKITLKDKAGNSVYKWISLTVDGDLKITTNSLPSATVGTAYTKTLTASGSDSFVWRVTGLPTGLTCSPSGVISGTPLSSGTWTLVDVYAYSPNGKCVNKYYFTLQVNGGLTITTASLPSATVGKSYKTTLKANGASSFVWRVTGLPTGLTCSPSGVISGTPLSSGTWTLVDVYAYSPNGKCVNKYYFTLQVNGGLTITTASLPSATVGKSYKTTLKASGASSFVWRVTGLPTGLTCSPSGVISGTPLSSGTWTLVDVYAYSPNGKYVNKYYFTLKVNGGLTITTKSPLPSATLGKSYKTTLKANGASSFVWRVTGLPTGLTCSPSGVISGTPLSSGTWRYVDVYVYSPNGNYVNKYYFTLTVNSASNTSTTQDQDNASTKSDKGSEGKSEIGSDLGTEQNESLVKFGTPRDVSSLSSEVLRDFANDGCIIAAVLPEIQVTKDGIYSFTVSIDKGVPMGSKLLWRSMPVNGEDVTDDDGGAVFTNVEGEEISTVPSDYSVNVSSWLRADRVYAPIILARSGSTDASVSSSSAETSEDSGNGGCNGGLASSALLMLVFITRKNRRAKRFC